MTSLFGVYECSADAKGRVMLPVAFKKQLSKELKGGFVLKRSIFSKSLELYPMATWTEMVKEVNKLNKFVKKNVEFIRMFNYGVIQVDPDSTGRLLIPKDLMVFAGMSKSIIMAAAGDRVEIWDKKAYDKFIASSSKDFEKLAEDVMGGITPSSNEEI
ncbi:MAG: division/cell wall cluster transcriptional repressor MraZ [Bacteroidota bacterium]|nr:division/cell wall cluster transcriptional repressor MraZ [Bacteroidota bacterium]